MNIKNESEALVLSIGLSVALGGFLGVILNDLVIGLALGFSMCAFFMVLFSRRKSSGECRKN